MFADRQASPAPLPSPEHASSVLPPIHFPAEAMTRLHGELLYQCAVNGLMQDTPTPAGQMGVLSETEMREMRRFYTEGRSPLMFFTYVLAVRKATAPMTLHCPRCECATVIVSGRKPEWDFSLCGCDGKRPWDDDEWYTLEERRHEAQRNEDGPEDSELPDPFGGGGESPSYREAMIGAGRGRLLR